MCGEKWRSPPSTTASSGSPPRVRGKGRPHASGAGYTRITPACAGKSGALFPRHEIVQDHPRVCGEKTTTRKTSNFVQGSPPRVRGKALSDMLLLSITGITPACAGKSGDHRRQRQQAQDHPRVCGEKAALMLLELVTPGSPPRVRGKAAHSFPGMKSFRITPACAGKRQQPGRLQTLCRDHPRVCGEKR